MPVIEQMIENETFYSSYDLYWQFNVHLISIHCIGNFRLTNFISFEKLLLSFYFHKFNSYNPGVHYLLATFRPYCLFSVQTNY